MIVIGNRHERFNVYRAGINELEPIGTIHKRAPGGLWEIAFIGRDWSFYDELLDGAEKRQIIGMLDKLNSKMDGRTPKGTLAWWQFIIGIPDATI